MSSTPDENIADDFLPAPAAVADSTPVSQNSEVVTPPLHRSTRTRNPPDRYRPENFT